MKAKPKRFKYVAVVVVETDRQVTKKSLREHVAGMLDSTTLSVDQSDTENSAFIEAVRVRSVALG